MTTFPMHLSSRPQPAQDRIRSIVKEALRAIDHLSLGSNPYRNASPNALSRPAPVPRQTGPQEIVAMAQTLATIGAGGHAARLARLAQDMGHGNGY
jgi:hypothetical protein